MRLIVLRVRVVEPVSMFEFDPSSGLQVVERKGGLQIDHMQSLQCRSEEWPYLKK